MLYEVITSVASGVDDVGGKPLEVSTGKGRLREVAAINGMAAAVLHTLEFYDAFIKLVIAHAGHVEVHGVQRLNGWFIMEQSGEGRRAANQVAGGDGQAEFLALAQLTEFGREIF